MFGVSLHGIVSAETKLSDKLNADAVLQTLLIPACQAGGNMHEAAFPPSVL